MEGMSKLGSGVSVNMSAAGENNQSAGVHDGSRSTTSDEASSELDRPMGLYRECSEEASYGDDFPHADVVGDTLKSTRYEEVLDELFDEMCMRLDDNEDWSGYLQTEEWLCRSEQEAAEDQLMNDGSVRFGESAPAERKPRSGFFKRHKLDFVLYALVAALVAAFFGFRAKGGPVLIGGYGVFTVATDSMNNVLPQGCLIVTKRVDPNLLEVGDDITFMNGPTSTVTHRIIGRQEVSEENAILQFYTQGTMNAAPDLVPVAAPNVVGKVIYSSLPLGRAIQYIRENWPLILVVMLIAYVWVSIVKNLFGSNRKHQHK